MVWEVNPHNKEDYPESQAYLFQGGMFVVLARKNLVDTLPSDFKKIGYADIILTVLRVFCFVWLQRTNVSIEIMPNPLNTIGCSISKHKQAAQFAYTLSSLAELRKSRHDEHDQRLAG